MSALELPDRADPLADPVATVQRWRAEAGDASDPVHTRVAEALARRAAAQQGECRRLMMCRVETLLAQAPVGRVVTAPAPRPAPALASLRELVDRLGRTLQAPTPEPATAAPGTARAPSPNKPAPLWPMTAPQPLKAATAFKATWSRLRADQRLRQAVADVPAMAGPLNSSQVVHRTLQALRELSPAYLDACMAHIDTLLWLEQASGTGGWMPRPAAPADSQRRPPPRVARKAAKK